jgi:hypothetical protein
MIFLRGEWPDAGTAYQLLSLPLKAIGDGNGQHCYRCNNEKQPKAYDQPESV